MEEAFDIAKASSKHGGLVVVRKGQLVFERYFGRGHRDAAPNLASCAKSFTSVAVGRLMDENPEQFSAGLEQKVFTTLHMPEDLFPLNDPRKSDIKLGQLLSMTAGIRGNSPGFIKGKPATIDPPGPDGWQACLDRTAATVDLWCSPGSGFSYATAGVHMLSMMIRRITGMELQAYIQDRIATPLQWGAWGWGYRRKEVTHTPGGGGIAVRAPDMIRFGELLLNDGRWRGQQVIASDYVRACGRLSNYNPHTAYSLQFDVNGDRHVPDVPGDAFWKTGSGGHCLYVVPSLETVIWKLGGRDEQYSSANTGIEDSRDYDSSREGWKSGITEAQGAIRALQTIAAAVA